MMASMCFMYLLSCILPAAQATGSGGSPSSPTERPLPSHIPSPTSIEPTSVVDSDTEQVVECVGTSAPVGCGVQSGSGSAQGQQPSSSSSSRCNVGEGDGGQGPGGDGAAHGQVQPASAATRQHSVSVNDPNGGSGAVPERGQNQSKYHWLWDVQTAHRAARLQRLDDYLPEVRNRDQHMMARFQRLEDILPEGTHQHSVGPPIGAGSAIGPVFSTLLSRGSVGESNSSGAAPAAAQPSRSRSPVRTGSNTDTQPLLQHVDTMLRPKSRPKPNAGPAEKKMPRLKPKASANNGEAAPRQVQQNRGDGPCQHSARVPPWRRNNN